MLNRRDFLKFAGITAGCAGFGIQFVSKDKGSSVKSSSQCYLHSCRRYELRLGVSSQL